ncbi:efflux RND transporter permease subunit [Escherichia coli]
MLAIILMMAGALAIYNCPSLSIQPLHRLRFLFRQYPGADARPCRIRDAQVIEQNMNGIDNLTYVLHQRFRRSVTITLTFQSGTDPDIAQVQVQNKLQLATPLLPQEVQQQGISVESPVAAI